MLLLQHLHRLLTNSGCHNRCRRIMQDYVHFLSYRKIFAVTLLFGAALFLFLYSDNTLNGVYYEDGYLELVNYTTNFSETRWKGIVQNNNTKGSIDLRNSNHTEVVTLTSILSKENSSVLRSIHVEIDGFTPFYNENTTDVVSSLTSSTFSSNSYQKSSSKPFNKQSNRTNNNQTLFKPLDYLIWSPECKIPNLNPFSNEAMKYFHKEKYISCSKHKLLSYLNISDNKATLFIDHNVLPSYTKQNISCCYSYVTRHGSKKKPDVGVKLSNCTSFENMLNMTQNTVKISCKVKNKEIYKNVHQAVTVKEKFLDSKVQPNTTRPPSILFVGIDSISRLNLIRAMPKTYQFLANRSETWYPLYGYNKIGENTFPNLMAIFTGYNDSEAYRLCNPKKIGPLDTCRFIWKEFKRFGYITAYGEDETSINTFNYQKKGFVTEPVDYYFKPYMEAAEALGTREIDHLSFCAGPETSAERIMNLAKNFAKAYKNYVTFGFFWMNTFSHNNLVTPSRVDNKVATFLDDITNLGILEDSIVVFLSDHGIRFGEIRHTFTGWLEERLPFIYFSFPKWFKEKHQQEIANFQTNANKLTTPYDVYMTLQHILQLSSFDYNVHSIDTCPACKSLFTEIGLNRSCQNTGITAHWCTCGSYTKFDDKDVAEKAASFLLSEVQNRIDKKGGKFKCAKFRLGKILTIYKSNKLTSKQDTYLLIVIETKPKAVFESTLYFKTDAKSNIQFSIESSISRLDSYAYHGRCVHEDSLKRYCFCK